MSSTTLHSFLLLAACCWCWLRCVVSANVDTSSWIDPHTPDEARTVTNVMDQRTLSLVFSDEFENHNRPFYNGADTRWTAEDRPGTTNAALHYYNSSHVYTDTTGKLVVATSRTNAAWTEMDPDTGQEHSFERYYQTGLLSTWNKFCFTSGMVEISFQLPGKAQRGGLWPAFWMLGNLGRPSYLKSTTGTWPWSYDTCGTSDEARNAQQGQAMNNCQSGVGRGSPEIDIFEAQPGDTPLTYTQVNHVDGSQMDVTLLHPIIASSMQIAPGVTRDRRPTPPNLPLAEQWYPAFYPIGGPAYGGQPATNGSTPSFSRMLNNHWYGQVIHDDPEVWQDVLSVNWEHDVSYYSQQTTLRLEWQAGKDDGYVRWFTGNGELIYEITADMLKAKPGAADAVAQIPYEAMYLILNTDVSPIWGWKGCDPNDPCMLENPGLCSADGELLCRDCGDPKCLYCLSQTAWLADFCQDVAPNQPAKFLIDYVRVYQDTTDPMHTLGCDPPDYPTKSHIEENWESYIFNPLTQKEPLAVVQHGGGSCDSDLDCGNFLAPEAVSASVLSNEPIRRSYCISGQCQCPETWTGPFCLVPCVGQYANCKLEPEETSNSKSRNVNVPMPLIALCVAGWLLAPFLYL